MTLRELVKQYGDRYGLNISGSMMLEINENGVPVLQYGWDGEEWEDDVQIVYHLRTDAYTSREIKDLRDAIENGTWYDFRDMADKHDATSYAEVWMGWTFVGRVNIYTYQSAFGEVQGVRIDYLRE
jgi:hypothetical protein